MSATTVINEPVVSLSNCCWMLSNSWAWRCTLAAFMFLSRAFSMEICWRVLTQRAFFELGGVDMMGKRGDKQARARKIPPRRRVSSS